MAQGGPPTIIREVLDDTIPNDDFIWWTKPPAEIGPAMVRVATKYETAGAARRDASRRYTQLHRGKRISGSRLDSGQASTLAEDLHPRWNIVQAAQNTAASVILRNRVRIAIMTDGADWEKQEAAKITESAIAGIFRGNKVYEELDPKWLLAAGVTGLGILCCEPNPVTGKPEIFEIDPDELVYSEVEARKGKPRQIFYVDWMSKWECIEKYGDTEEKCRVIIASTNTYSLPLIGSPDQHVPMIPVWHGWFLPGKQATKKKAKGEKETEEEECNGRRVTAIGDCTLSWKPWEWPRFPMAFLRTEWAPAGLWGIGLAERLAGTQYALFEINDDIRKARRMGSNGKWMISTAANVNDDELTDDQGDIVHHAGGPDMRPHWELNDGIPQSLLQERETEYNQGLKDVGMSAWSVSAVQPDNIKSGEGLRVLEEKEEGRAVPAGQNWESAHIDLAEIVLMSVVDGYEINKDLEIWTEEDMGDDLTLVRIEEIVDLLLSKDSWRATAFPTSFLPTSPQGRFEKIKDWEDKGWIDSATAAMLSDMPDTSSEKTMLLAGIKTVHHFITKIKRKGQLGYEPPDPALPLELAARIAQSTYLQGLRTNMPEDRLALLQEWGNACRDLLRTGAPAPVASTPSAAAPGAPVAPVNAPVMDPALGAPPVNDVAPVAPFPPAPSAAGGMVPGTGPV